MRKIKYPSDRTALESDYWKLFKDLGLQTEWVRLRNLLIGWSDSPDKETVYPVQIRDVVCGKYEKLVDIYLDYKAIKKKKSGGGYYTFRGWALQPDGNPMSFNISEQLVYNTPITWYAIWGE